MTSREMFDAAIVGVLQNEGDKFTNHPADKGGPTKYGISKKFHPDVDVENLTREQAIEIYWNRYWDGNDYDKLPFPIGLKLFDLAVNMGKPQAIKLLQRAIRAAGHPLKDDGILGSKTILAANDVIPGILIVAMKSESAGFYRSLVAKNPSQSVFLDGWLNRAYA